MILKEVTEFKKSNFYTNVLETITSLDESIKPLIRYVGFLFLFLIPIIIIYFFYSENLRLKKDLQTGEALIKTSQEYLDLKKSNLQINTGANNRSFVSISEFDDFIIDIYNNQEAIASKLESSDFSSEDFGSGYLKNSITTHFEKMSTDKFSALINTFVNEHGLKIDKIKIKKNTETNTLDGSITLLSFGKKQ